MAAEPSQEKHDEFDRQAEPTRSNSELDKSPPNDFDDRDIDPDQNNQLEDELQEELAADLGIHHGRKRQRLYCFGCSRPEGHYLTHQNRWYFSYMLGLTFGLMRFIGPFRCQCCGSQRLMWADIANIRYLISNRRATKKSNSRHSGSRKSKSRRSSSQR